VANEPAELIRLRAELTDLRERFAHFYVKSAYGRTGSCASCGLDVRNPIHKRNPFHEKPGQRSH
jgi:hypothetical protein